MKNTPFERYPYRTSHEALIAKWNRRFAFIWVVAGTAALTIGLLLLWEAL